MGSSILPPNLSSEAEQLIHAVDVALSATASSEARNQAYLLCEKFKEESPLCATIGFQLARHGNNFSIKHFGLQLVEHCIKFRWNCIHTQEKIFIKNSVWEIIQNGTETSCNEPSFIKDGIARLVVEMVKREWPQQWPSFLVELTQLTQGECKEFQIEIVLLILLRLTEDVAVFQSVESSRRKDLYQALTANMSDIFDFLSQLLQLKVQTFLKYQANAGDNKLALLNCRLAQSVLTCFQAHVDWVSINHIMAHDGKLLEQLCLLLSVDNLRLAAAECLLQIVSRKGPLKERKPLLILYSHGGITSMLQAAEKAASQPLSETNYSFLKRLAEVLVGLGTQLCSLYGKEDDVAKPDTFVMYLSALLALTGHPSLSINHIITGLWLTLFRHDSISSDSDLVGVLNSWINITAQKLRKVGYPSRNDDAACAYSRLDFESDEDFSTFSHRLRTDILEAVRLATSIAPLVTFSYAEHWLQQQLEKAAPTELCTPVSEAVLEWEVIAVFLDCVVSKSTALAVKEGCQPLPSFALNGLQLLESCLRYQSNDPLVLSGLLSCISAMFIFVKQDPQRVQGVLDRILAAMMFTLPGQTKDCRSRTVRNVRRHACSLIVKISIQHPQLLLPCFDYLKNSIEKLCLLSEDAAQLSRMERVTLQEALLIISNQFNNFEMQTQFIGQVIRPAAEQWKQPNLQIAFESAAGFMSFVGLDTAPVEPSNQDIKGQNRSELVLCTNIFLAIVKRCRAPQDPSAAMQNSGSSEVAVCHPAAPHLAPLLFNTFRLARVLHGLWEPAARCALAPGFVKAYDMLDSEIVNLMGQGAVSSNGSGASMNMNSIDSGSLSSDHTRVVSPLERVQQFLAQLHFNVFNFLGSLGETLGHEFYALPGLATAVAGTACYCLEHIPDYRLRVVIRVFCRPFIVSCPSNLHESVLLPVLLHLCPALLHRLTQRWEKVVANAEHQPDEHNGADFQEVVQDMIGRMLTREYIDVLKLILFTSAGASDSVAGVDDDMETSENTHADVSVSELGKMVLSHPVLGTNVIQCILSGLWWPDTTVSMKATLVLGSLMKYWGSLGGPHVPSFPSQELASHCLSNVLNGLQMLGRHEANLGALIHLGVILYDTFLPVYPTLSDVLMRHTNCTREDVIKYEEKTLASNNAGVKPTQKGEKFKREMFRKITSLIIGQDLGQLFKKSVAMASLPKMGSLKPRVKQDILDATDIGLSSLFIEDN